MGGKKKQSTKKAERGQVRKGEKEEAKPSGSSSERERKTAGIVPPNPRSEKTIKEIRKMKTLTPFAVAARFNIRLSVAKDLLEQMEQKGAIQLVSRGRNLKIYASVD